jgi:hypothetical protein
MQPARDLIVVDALPGGTPDPSVDPSVDRSLPLDRQTGSVVDINATFPFGAEIRTAEAGPVSRDICGPALAEKGTSTSRSRMCRGGESMSFRS